MLVMVRPDWPCAFRRTVPSGDGGPGVVYVFELGVAVEVAGPDLRGIAADIGKALVIPVAGTNKPDWKATKQAAAEIAARGEDDDFDEDELPPVTVTTEEAPADEFLAELEGDASAAPPADEAPVIDEQPIQPGRRRGRR